MEYVTRHLYFSYTHGTLGECVYEENTSDKWHTVSHEKTLHKYFIPYLNLRKNYGNQFQKFRKKDLGKFWKIFGNLGKLLEIFGNSSKVFANVLWFFKMFRKSTEAFGNLRIFSENFGNGSKAIFRCFYDFLKFSENLRKSSQIFGKLRERFPRNFQMFLWFFFNFRKIFRNLRKFL